MSDPVTTFTWLINTLERHTATGIVFHIHFTIQATDGTYTETANGSIPIEEPPSEGYTVIPYDQLTEEQCLTWLQERVGTEQVDVWQNNLEQVLTEKRAPTKAHGKPWA